MKPKTIRDLITELEAIATEHGDLPVTTLDSVHDSEDGRYIVAGDVIRIKYEPNKCNWERNPHVQLQTREYIDYHGG